MTLAKFRIRIFDAQKHQKYESVEQVDIRNPADIWKPRWTVDTRNIQHLANADKNLCDAVAMVDWELGLSKFKIANLQIVARNEFGNVLTSAGLWEDFRFISDGDHFIVTRLSSGYKRRYDLREPKAQNP